MEHAEMPPCLCRTTYRDMRSPNMSLDGEFETDRRRDPKSQTWTSLLNAEVIEHHLDRDHKFTPAEPRMLISFHADRDRAASYASVQRQRLFFDSTYRHPAVCIHVIEAQTIKQSFSWKRVPLQGQNAGKYLWVLSGPDCCFFSSMDAVRTFGSINSHWLTRHEWFAIDRVPETIVGTHLQIADGKTLGSHGRPYILTPIPLPTIPEDIIMIEGGIGALLKNLGNREVISDEEADEQHARAMEMAMEGSRFRTTRSADDSIHGAVARRSEVGFGRWTECIEPNSELGIDVLVLPRRDY